MAGPSVIKPLAEALAIEKRTATRQRLTQVLLGFGAAGRPAVEQLRASANPAVRRTAIHLLREFGGTEALPDLTALLDDAEPHVQREAVRAILSIGTEEAYAELQRALATSSNQTREALTGALVSMRSERAIPLFEYIVRKIDQKGPVARGVPAGHRVAWRPQGRPGSRPVEGRALQRRMVGAAPDCRASPHGRRCAATDRHAERAARAAGCDRERARAAFAPRRAAHRGKRPRDTCWIRRRAISFPMICSGASARGCEAFSCTHPAIRSCRGTWKRCPKPSAALHKHDAVGHHRDSRRGADRRRSADEQGEHDDGRAHSALCRAGDRAHHDCQQRHGRGVDELRRNVRTPRKALYRPGAERCGGATRIGEHPRRSRHVQRKRAGGKHRHGHDPPHVRGGRVGRKHGVGERDDRTRCPIPLPPSR